MTRQTATQIEREASEWLMRIDREGPTPELRAALEVWLAGDRRRRGAWLQAEAAWAMLDGLGAVGDDIGEQAPRRFGRRRMLAGAAAALAASLAGGFFLRPGEDRYVTEVGEIRQVPLADGSSAAINTNSRLAVVYAPARRTVRLESGEAFFQVARDPARPFMVEAGRVRAMAIGTAFSVRRRDDGADVMVTEGVVEAWADGAEGNRVRLTAGQRAFIANNAAIVEPPPVPSGVDRALAWRSGQIDLAGETLRHATDEFNRYNRRQIVIADPRLAGERFYGIFRTDDPEGFALAVHGSLHVPVHAEIEAITIGRPAR